MAESQKQNHISEHILEIRYKPNPQFLDYRGTFSEAVAQLLGLNHWRIDENRVDVFNDNKTTKGFVSYNNFGLVIQDSYDKNYFPNQANKLIKYVLSQKPFANPIVVNRIGVRARFAFEAKLEFQALLDKFRSRYYTLSDKVGEIFNGEPIDAGLFLNFKSKLGMINTQSGPMNKKQLSAYFPDASVELPEVSYYLDLDYWKEPKQEISNDAITSTVKDFSFTSWDQIYSIWGQINE